MTMEQIKPVVLSYYDTEVAKLLSDKYNIEPMQAFRKFLQSDTYKMLADSELEMWEFSPNGIFDMWECEQITGTPKTSAYLREP